MAGLPKRQILFGNPAFLVLIAHINSRTSLDIFTLSVSIVKIREVIGVNKIKSPNYVTDVMADGKKW